MPGPDVRLHAVQRIILLVEGAVFHMRSAQKIAVQSICPAVIGALDAALKFSMLLAAHSGSAVAANIEEGAHSPACFAGHNDAFPGYFRQIIIARIRHLLRSPAAEPHLAEKCFQLLLKYSGVRVVTPRQSLGRRAHSGVHGTQSSLSARHFATSPNSAALPAKAAKCKLPAGGMIPIEQN